MLAAMLSCCVLPGCRSPSQYVSPRITGHVLDAERRQPIRDASVVRVFPYQPARSDTPPKGAQLLRARPGVQTGDDGAFTLDSERSLVFFRTVGWYSVTLSITHPGYVAFTTNYTLADATNTTRGEPLINAGDILLKPLPK